MKEAMTKEFWIIVDPIVYNWPGYNVYMQAFKIRKIVKSKCTIFIRYKYWMRAEQIFVLLQGYLFLTWVHKKLITNQIMTIHIPLMILDLCLVLFLCKFILSQFVFVSEIRQDPLICMGPILYFL